MLILFENRLDRDAYSALGAVEQRFQPLAAPSIGTAQRMLSECGASAYSVLIESSMLGAEATRLVRSHPPQAVVAIRSESQRGARLRGPHVPRQLISRDTPWREVCRRLAGSAAPDTDAPADAGDDASRLESLANKVSSDEHRLSSLTRRERQVLELIAGGAAVRECATSLEIAESTVDNHKSNLMKKVGARKSAELVRFAFRVGLAP